MISILILTKNEERDLPNCLKSVSWSDDIHVYDSFSSDGTLEIARSYGAKITQRVFDNWSSHQNWGLENIVFSHPWVLYIDADERVSETLKEKLLEFDAYCDHTPVAYEIQRRDFAWNGKWLKHSQISPFYLRLFLPNKMRYERLVNPISIPDGNVGRISGYLDHYPFSKGIKFWLQRHLNYADLEAKTLCNFNNGQRFSLRKAIWNKDFTNKRFHQKGLFYKLPGRPLIKCLYMIVWRKGFLDGSAGITYATLQAIYEYFIVLKTRELKENQ